MRPQIANARLEGLKASWYLQLVSPMPRPNAQFEAADAATAKTTKPAAAPSRHV